MMKRVYIQNLLAGLSYLGILFLIPLFFAKGHPFVAFHVKQGIVLFVIQAIVSIVPFIGWIFALFLFGVGAFAFLRAASGVRWEIPFIAPYAEKIAL